MTTLELAQQHAPGSRTVTFTYGKIPGYRDPKHKSWGFAISDPAATVAWYNQYTCSRRSAKRLWEEELKPAAEERGFNVVLVVAEGCGLAPDLTQS